MRTKWTPYGPVASVSSACTSARNGAVPVSPQMPSARSPGVHCAVPFRSTTSTCTVRPAPPREVRAAIRAPCWLGSSRQCVCPAAVNVPAYRPSVTPTQSSATGAA